MIDCALKAARLRANAARQAADADADGDANGAAEASPKVDCGPPKPSRAEAARRIDSRGARFRAARLAHAIKRSPRRKSPR